MKNELVSIITPSYNSSQYIAETIESIIAQTYTNWELLITDDCSTDNSRDIIQEYCEKDSRIKLFCLPHNGGAGVARNNSIKEAQGRFIAFCDSDDCWKPDKLQVQIKYMQENDCSFTFTSYDICDENGRMIGIVHANAKLTYNKLLRSNDIGCLTSIYDCEKFGKIYMPIIRKRQDWGLWLKVIKHSKYAYGIKDSLAVYRNRQGSISSNKIAMLKYNYILYHEVEGFSKIASICMLCGYFLPYHFYKKIKNKLLFIVNH